MKTESNMELISSWLPENRNKKIIVRIPMCNDRCVPKIAFPGDGIKKQS